MKSISQSRWFEVQISYEKTMEDGLTKQISELYLVDALSFTEAEKHIIEEMSSYFSGGFEVTKIKKVGYKEVFLKGSSEDVRFYKTKLMMITLDEKTEKEKRTAYNILVEAPNFQSAVKYVEEGMKGSMMDYEIASISETQILDVFLHNKILTEPNQTESLEQA